jgi:hypothetical protein
MKKFIISIPTIAVIVIGLTVFSPGLVSAAGIIYDNGPSTHTGGAAVGHLISADDFVLNSNFTITGASVDVRDGPANENRQWDGSVYWWILNTNGGQPGSVSASGSGQNIVESNLVPGPFGNDFTVTFDFGQNIPYAAGTDEWLALHLAANYDIVSVFWDHTGSITNNPAYAGIEEVGGVPDYNGQFFGPIRTDLAFRLIGSTSITPAPEPATFLLLGSGILGIVIFRRKFRK